jgi:hypothetical protein
MWAIHGREVYLGLFPGTLLHARKRKEHHEQQENEGGNKCGTAVDRMDSPSRIHLKTKATIAWVPLLYPESLANKQSK